MIVAIIFRPFGLLIYMLTYFLYILLLIHKLYIQKQNVQTVRQELSNTHLQSGQGKYYTGESNLCKTLQEKIENVYCVILAILETSFITYFHVQNSMTIAIYLFAKNVEIEQTH
jgi:hypothetical protein